MEKIHFDTTVVVCMVADKGHHKIYFRVTKYVSESKNIFQNHEIYLVCIILYNFCLVIFFVPFYTSVVQFKNGLFSYSASRY